MKEYKPISLKLKVLWFNQSYNISVSKDRLNWWEEIILSHCQSVELTCCIILMTKYGKRREGGFAHENGPFPSNPIDKTTQKWLLPICKRLLSAWGDTH